MGRDTEPDGPQPAGEAADGDALDHLWTAAQEMLRAMRMVIDAADEFVASQRGARPAPWPGSAGGEERPGREGRVHHIDIDLRADDAADPSGHAGARPDAPESRPGAR